MSLGNPRSELDVEPPAFFSWSTIAIYTFSRTSAGSSAISMVWGQLKKDARSGYINERAAAVVVLEAMRAA
jgi:hypothetical protein